MLVGRLVGLHLTLWMILLEEGTDPRHASWVLLGMVSDLAVLAAAGQHQTQALSPNQTCPLPTVPSPAGPAAAPVGPPFRVWALRGPATEEQSQGETMGSVFKSKGSFLLQD